MKKNMGAMDRIVRFFIVLIIAALWAVGVLSGTVAMVFGGIAVIFLATSFFSVCPIYMALGWSTVEKTIKKKKR